MYPKEISWLPAIILLLPLLGALFNGLFGKRLGKGAVRLVGVAAPAAAFVLTLAAFFGMYVADYGSPIDDARVVAVRAPSGAAFHRAKLAIHQHPDARNWLVGEEGERVIRIRVPRAIPEQAEDLAPGSPFLSQLEADYGVKAGPASVIAPRVYTADLGKWIAFGDLEVRFNFTVDRLAIVLMLVITGVGTLIHLYSASYMGAEPAGTFARYFTYLNLFVGAMLVLVTGANMLLLFIGWEGVGLCSYLLIGFEYKDADKAACGSKAFIVNRIGDVGFVLGTLTLLVAARNVLPGEAVLSLDFAQLNGIATAVAPGVLGAACLLLFLGATGKSAQLPLQLWLPDAMAGPTPVSALIHAATMVTAGVYLIARLNPVFAHAEVGGVPVLGIVAIVGVLTAFFAGTAALGQDDLKKVLAYSTISQLGYMFVAVGAMAFGAAIFHLVTHAFFKALLFLGAGAVIHATHTQSMKEMGGLRRLMPTTYWTMLIGAGALAGLPPLSGFFSKDMILFETLVRFKSEHSSMAWGAVYAIGVLTGLITAIYSTRMVCMTFFGSYRGHGHPHEAPPAMAAPLVILAILAAVAGLLGLPALIPYGAELLPKTFLQAMWRDAAGVLPPGPDEHALHVLEYVGLGVGAAAAVLGLAIGWVIWGKRHPDEVPWESAEQGGLARARAVLANAWYYDEGLNKRFVQPVVKYLSTALWKHVDDTAIDRGLVDGAGRVSVQLSLFARVFQNGRVSRYVGYLVAGAVVVAIVPALFALFS